MWGNSPPLFPPLVLFSNSNELNGRRHAKVYPAEMTSPKYHFRLLTIFPTGRRRFKTNRRQTSSPTGNRKPEVDTTLAPPTVTSPSWHFSQTIGKPPFSNLDISVSDQ